MARFALAAERGGAAGLRVNGPSDIEAVRRATRLPVLGLQKRNRGAKLLITPSFEDARSLVKAGAQIIAVECTSRTRSWGALDVVRRIRAELDTPVMADIATLEEAIDAEAAGADLVASTMRGYTPETASITRFEPGFIAQLAAGIHVPVLAEGRVETPEQGRLALESGAFAVIVGGAITRPEAITARFARALASARRSANGGRRRPENGPAVIGIDIGGSHTKAAVLTASDALESESTAPTPAHGREPLLQFVSQVAREKLREARRNGYEVEALGVATAGWVNPVAGRIVYASQNLPGWTGTRLAGELEQALGLPVAVENDANALAIGEHRFGIGREVEDFVCLTLGTGVGGGCYSGGRLLRGARCLANALGHIPIVPDGRRCGCGLRGCLEGYANAAALMEYAGGEYASAEAVIRAAHSGTGRAREALHIYAGYLANGIAAIVHVLDPAVLVLAGGIAQQNEYLFSDLNESIRGRLLAAEARQLRIVPSRLGYHGAVYGVAAMAREKIGALAAR